MFGVSPRANFPTVTTRNLHHLQSSQLIMFGCAEITSEKRMRYCTFKSFYMGMQPVRRRRPDRRPERRARYRPRYI